MAIFAHTKHINVHVYEYIPGSHGLIRRVSTCQGSSDDSAQEAHVIYMGRAHYDAIYSVTKVTSEGAELPPLRP